MASKTSTRINPKSVTILAMGPTTAQYIHRIGGQFERPTKHVWAINNAGMWFHDIDLIIAMDDFKRDRATHPKYVKALTNRGVPILTCTAYKQYPSLEEFPLREVLDYLCIDPGDPHPLDNSCNYALAYAMYKGMKEIHLLGYEFRKTWSAVKLYEADEFAKMTYGENVPSWFKYYMKDYMPQSQEPGENSCCYLLGLCKGRNISIRISYGTTLMNADLPHFYYGFQEPPKL